MLKVVQEVLTQLEGRYPGVVETIMRFENAQVPPCPRCASEDTARVLVGIIGRTINIAAVTTKVTLVPNGPPPGKWRCNTCEEYFG